jgi:hypothetical protein
LKHYFAIKREKRGNKESKKEPRNEETMEEGTPILLSLFLLPLLLRLQLTNRNFYLEALRPLFKFRIIYHSPRGTCIQLLVLDGYPVLSQFVNKRGLSHIFLGRQLVEEIGMGGETREVWKWRDGGKGWRDGGMEGWRDGRMEGCRDGGMEGWRDGGMEGTSKRNLAHNHQLQAHDRLLTLQKSA